MRNGCPFTNAAQGIAAVVTSESAISASPRCRVNPRAISTAAPAPPIATRIAPLSIRVPQAISSAAISGWASALFSGMKKSVETNHAPTTTRLKRAKARSAIAGQMAIAVTRRRASGSGAPRRHSVHAAAVSAEAVTGQAS